MAITARITTGTTIGGAAIQQRSRSTIVSQKFDPKPNVSLSELNDVSASGVEDDYTLIFNSATNLWESQPLSNVAILSIAGGTF